MKITVVGLSQLREKLNGIRNRTADLRPALYKSAVLVLDKSKIDMRMGGDPPWQPTKFPSNLHPPLISTGTLFRSLSDGEAISDISNGVRVGTNIFYAKYLQYGTRRMPARPLLANPSDDPLRDRIKQTIADFIARGE